jgi:hypothetical protein
MPTKIFVALLSLACAVSAALELYGRSWLSSIGDPRAAFEGFAYYQSFAWAFLWTAAPLLLIVGNVVLWTTRRAWGLWAAFAYFSVFVAVRYFVTGPAGFAFYRTIEPNAGRFDLSVFLGVVFVVLAAAIVYFDQFLVLRLNERMYPPTNAGDEPSEDAAESV